MKERQQREKREGRGSRRDSKTETFPQGFHAFIATSFGKVLVSCDSDSRPVSIS
jgi:hypothetical protein